MERVMGFPSMVLDGAGMFRAARCFLMYRWLLIRPSRPGCLTRLPPDTDKDRNQLRRKWGDKKKNDFFSISLTLHPWQQPNTRKIGFVRGIIQSVPPQTHRKQDKTPTPRAVAQNFTWTLSS
ncbi:hypothetical protein APED_31655 [Acanthopleuribacter pedis]